MVLKYANIYEQVKLLFAGERKVCDQIFEGFDSLAEQCFAEVTTNSVSMLLSFGDAIAKSKRSPEKLFVLLDMYEIMQELHSEVLLLSFKIILLQYLLFTGLINSIARAYIAMMLYINLFT